MSDSDTPSEPPPRRVPETMPTRLVQESAPPSKTGAK